LKGASGVSWQILGSVVYFITTTKIKWKESGPLLKWDVIYASVFLEVRKKRRQHQILELDQHVYFNDPTVGKVPLSSPIPIPSHCIGLMTPEGVFHGSIGGPQQ